MGSRVGIDIGTINSVATFKWTSDSIRVGEPARQARSNPENIISSIKRLIGRGFNEQAVQEQIKRFPYKTTAPTQGTVFWGVVTSG